MKYFIKLFVSIILTIQTVIIWKPERVINNFISPFSIGIITFLIAIFFFILMCCGAFVQHYNMSKRGRYIVIITLFCLFYYGLFILTRGGVAVDVLVTDYNDTYMDFFHSVANAAVGNPYDNFSNYPAMALLIYRILFHGIPLELNSIGGFGLRNIQMAQIMFILYNIFIVGGLLYIIEKKCTVKGIEKSFLKLFIFLSAPIMFTIERGNIIMLAFLFTMFFVFYYQSENKLVRELAYLSIAFAAALKIYPAIFGLLLVKDKKWKEAIKLAIYGVIMFLLPFVFYGGFNGLKTMIDALLYSSNVSMLDKEGFGANVSFTNIIALLLRLLGIEGIGDIVNILYIIFVIVIFAEFILCKRKLDRILILTLMLMMLPKMSFYYTAIFLIIPFICMLNEMEQEKCWTKRMFINAIFFTILLVPWASGTIESVSIRTHIHTSYSMLLQYVTLLVMVGVLGVRCIKDPKLEKE